jgi:hypothetical protein
MPSVRMAYFFLSARPDDSVTAFGCPVRQSGQQWLIYSESVSTWVGLESEQLCTRQAVAKAEIKVSQVTIALHQRGRRTVVKTLKPDITSSSSSSIDSWRMRCNLRFKPSSMPSIIFSARSIAARRLAFSLANDSAHAWNSRTNRCSRMN